MKSIVTISLFVLLSPTILSSQTPEQSYFDWTKLPFSQEELEDRRSKLIDILQKQQKSGWVIIPSMDGFSFGETFRQLNDFYYFTGLELPNALLVLDITRGRSMIYAPKKDKRFENGTRINDFPGRPLATDPQISEATGIPIFSFEEFDTALQLASNSETSVLLNNGRPGPVIFSGSDYIVQPTPVQILINGLKAKHNNLVFENIYSTIAAVRMIKSPAEIETMRIAVDITVLGIKKAAKAIKSDVTERYLEGVLEGDFKFNGSQRLAFGSIIKSGPNSLWPWRILATHYDRRNRVMQEGELVIFDVGCEYNHYVSDVGRTFPVSGTFSDRQKEILIMETDIADQIIEFIKPGITFNDIKKLTDKIIPEDAKKYMQVGLFFGHHLGLSTGDPKITSAALQPGMIFTVEPWYYNHDENIAVFTEDVILVTQDGSEVLSNQLPRTPEELEQLMKE